MTIDVSQIQKFLQEGYELKELPGGYWAPKPECSQYKLMCGASLTDSAAQSFMECGAYYDVDGDGQQELIVAWDPNSKILEVIKKTSDGWKAICYQLTKPPENPVQAFLEALGNFAFNVLPASVLAALGTVGRVVGRFLGGIASTIEAAVGLGIIIVILVILIILKR